MASEKIVGYKNIFGFVLPDWVDESLIRLIVSFLLSSAVMFFVLIFLIWPKFDDIKSLKASLSTKMVQLEALRDSKAGFDKLSDEVAESAQDMVLQAIPRVYSPENAVFMLRGIANETPGLSIVSYKLPAGVLFEAEETSVVTKNVKDDESASFISYPISLSITAPVESLLSFIRKVETTLPFGVVSDLGMQEVSRLSNSSAGDKLVKMELEVKYYQVILKQVDIAKIKPISSDDLVLIDTLSTFSQMTQSTGDGGIPSVSGNTGGLFGF
jgi:hypothetical protein